MPREMPVQLHIWPWSANNPARWDGHKRGETLDLTGGSKKFPYYGSPVISVSKDVSLFLPARHERFVALGPAYDTIHGKYQLYEVPHGVFAGREKDRKSSYQYITIRTHGASNRIHLHPEGVREEDKRLEAVISAWYQQFEILIKKVGERHFSWEHLEKYFFPEDDHKDEPRMALIVKIANDMDQKLQMIVFAARKILLRERKMVPMARVTEMDTSCLKWLGRQPGSDFAQKAAMHKHRLLGVLRYESFDTLENKILKDFLKRCEQAASQYIETEVGDNQIFQKSSRTKRVRGFRQLCRMLHTVPHLESVSSPPLSFSPNYVLQNDYRYRQVWHHYIRLLRSEEEKDRIWDWQNRTWSDLVRIMVCLTLFRFSGFDQINNNDHLVAKEMFSSSPKLSEEQHIGCWLEPGCEPGPFIMKRSEHALSEASILEIVHPAHAAHHKATKLLGQLGGHLYLVITSLSQHATTVVVIWAVHTGAVEQHPAWNKVGMSAEQALYNQRVMFGRMRELPRLKGIVVASDLDIKESDIQPAEQGGVHIVQVAADPRNWEEAVDGIEIILDEALQDII